MTDPSTASTRPTDSTTTIWDTLRQRMEQLSSADSASVDSARLAKRLAERAKLLRQRLDAGRPEGKTLIYVALRQAAQRYGLPVEQVIEVQHLVQFSPVPGAPGFIRGVVHWRGAILALLDVARLLGIVEHGISDLHVFVVVEAAGRRLGLVASSVEDIINIAESDLKPAPQLPADIPADWVAGVHDQNRLILRLDQMLSDPRLVDWRRRT